MPEKLPTWIKEGPEQKPEENIEKGKEGFVEFKEEEFDMGAALEKPGFYDFLGRHIKGGLESLDKEQVKNLYEAFEASSVTGEFYREIIKEKSGVEIKDEEIRSGLELYFINAPDPKFGAQTIELIKEYRELPVKISEKEKELAKLGGKEGVPKWLAEEEAEEGPALERLGALTEAEERLSGKKIKSEQMTGIRGFFNWRNSEAIRAIFGATEWLAGITEKFSKEGTWLGEKARGAKKKIQGVRGEIREYRETKAVRPEAWQREIDQTHEAMRKDAEKLEASRDNAEVLRSVQEKYRDYKEKMENIQSLIFGQYFEPAKDIMAIAKSRLREKLAGMARPDVFDPNDYIVNIEEGMELLEKVGKSGFGFLETKEIRDFSEKFEKGIALKVKSDIASALVKLGGGRPFKEMEKDLRKLLESKTYGAKKRQVDLKYVREELGEYVRSPKAPEGESEESFKAKKIAVKLFLIKIN